MKENEILGGIYLLVIPNTGRKRLNGKLQLLRKLQGMKGMKLPSSSSKSLLEKEQSNEFYLDNFHLLEALRIDNFFDNVLVIREKSPEFPYSEYF
jgi:hypothetical protein